MRASGDNQDVDMLTATSILKNLPEKHFDSYKKLLSGVARYWEAHASRLPAELGPMDVVVRAASLRLIRRNEDGSIDVVVTKMSRKTTVAARKSPNKRKTAAIGQ